MNRMRLPMNLQFFAEGGTNPPGGAAGAQNPPGAAAQNPLGAVAQNPPGAAQNPPRAAAQNPPAGTIDYGKIQQMLDGTLAAKEDTALKAYFEQQGLTQQEAEQAIAAFKEQKAKNQPDVGALQAQVAKYQSDARQAMLTAAATMAAVSLGIDSKTIPYVLKMADLSKVIGQDGKVNEETLKAALNKVLEDVPALKPQAAGNTGFVQVGTGGNPGQQAQQPPANPKPAVATKKWNRFN